MPGKQIEFEKSLLPSLKYVYTIRTVIIGELIVSKTGADILATYKLEFNVINFTKMYLTGLDTVLIILTVLGDGTIGCATLGKNLGCCCTITVGWKATGEGW